MKRRIDVAILVLFSSFSLAGCAQNSQTAGEGSSDDNAPGAAGEGSLPSIPKLATEVLNCGDTPVEPDVCTWALSADAVVYGEIQSVTFVDSPSVQPDGTVAASCTDGSVNGAVEIGLMSVEALIGNVPDTLSFRIGTEQFDRWTAFPVQTASGDVEWRGVGALVPGQRMGAALHFSDRDQIWSLMGEHLFTFGSSDSLQFQAGDTGCGLKPPRAQGGATFANLEATLQSCQGSADADARRTTIESTWGSAPEYYMLGYCIPDEPVNTSGCLLDSDCTTEQLCVDGKCEDS